MRFLVLPSVFHGGEIHCLDINKDNTGLITGGKDHCISIWNLLELVEVAKLKATSSEIELKQKVEVIKPIHHIKCHDSTVTMLRWLPNTINKFISGSSSGRIYYHDLRDDNNSIHKQIYPFNESTAAQLKPVVDLSVSRDGRLVAWSTLDEKLYVYDVEQNTFQELSTPSSEKPVIQRSLAFNGVSNYLVSIGDDTQINVFQYEYDSTSSSKLYKFRLINKISKLFSKNPLNVKYKRISWSPDGELVSIPTATKNQTSLISLLSSSKNWATRASLVGHDLTCEVVKFNPHLYSEREKEMNNIYNIIASGGLDRTVTIWNTSKTAPIMILRDVVDAQIYDLVWTTTNSLLFCTSRGNLGILSFDENELGFKVSNKTLEKLRTMQRDLIKPMTYRYEFEQPSGNRKTLAPIEYTDQKDAVSALAQVESTPVEKETTEQTNTEKKSSAVKKGEVEPEVLTASEPSTETIITTTTASTTASTITPINESKNLSQSPPSHRLQEGKAATETKPIQALRNQKVTTKNGKRRIQPMLISGNSSSTVSGLPKSSSSTFLSMPSESIPASANNAKSLMEFNKPSYSVSEELNRSKRVRSENLLNGNNGSLKKPKREMEPVKFIGSVITNPNTSFSKVRLATPKVRFGFQLKSQDDDSNFYTFDVKNGSGNEAKPSRVTFFKKEKEIWCDFVPKYIQLASEGHKFWAIATIDGQILTYSRVSGKRLLPTIILGSPISFLESHGNYLMAVTSIGELYVWDMVKKKNEVTCSISALLELSSKFSDDGLSRSDNITMCAITSRGIPLVTLSNGSGYLYNQDLEVWLVITESWWLFGSYYWDSVEDGKKTPQTLNMFNSEESIIELLEHKTNEEILRKRRSGRGKYFNKISKNMIMKEGFESLENTISISHLENRILCCELLGENKDFHKFFKTYVQRICELGFKAKLYEVCDDLLGPIDDDQVGQINGASSNWDSKICGLDRRELLKEVITLCSQFRDAQRVLYHFGKKIGLIDVDVSVDDQL
ncbi:HIR2 [Candida oxycetoniae]|uniref:Protein HIR n=1 Tax=Candida oxycetoniae TaxID=497107 RepID=A0AAI9WWI8_9ASCO|nr:HIR2 [Candida oxycetoniae]KAI3403266.2 HIR2 [Candida oxycetoniae]